MNTSNGFLKNEYHLKEPQNRAVPSANNVVNMPQNICRQVCCWADCTKMLQNFPSFFFDAIRKCVYQVNNGMAMRTSCQNPG